MIIKLQDYHMFLDSNNNKSRETQTFSATLLDRPRKAGRKIAKSRMIFIALALMHAVRIIKKASAFVPPVIFAVA